MIKKLSIVALGCAVASSAFAMNTGYYVGLQLGKSYADIGSTTQTVSGTSIQYKKNKRQAFAGRLQYGYMSTPSFGLEINLTKYGEANWDVTAGSSQSKATFNAYNLDFLMRFDLNVHGGFDLYAKPGAALIRARYKDKVSNFDLDQTEWFLRPELAVGASYSFNKKWTMELEADRVFGKGSLANAVSHENASWYLPNLTLYTVGVTYGF